MLTTEKNIAARTETTAGLNARGDLHTGTYKRNLPFALDQLIRTELRIRVALTPPNLASVG